VAFVVDTKGKTLAEVATFPVMTTEEVAQTAQEPEPLAEPPQYREDGAPLDGDGTSRRPIPRS
jgi:hypothetical protein